MLVYRQQRQPREEVSWAVRYKTPQNNIRELGQKRKFTEENPSWKSALVSLKTLLVQYTWEIKVDSPLYPGTQGTYKSSGLGNPCSFRTATLAKMALGIRGRLDNKV